MVQAVGYYAYARGLGSCYLLMGDRGNLRGAMLSLSLLLPQCRGWAHQPLYVPQCGSLGLDADYVVHHVY